MSLFKKISENLESIKLHSYHQKKDKKIDMNSNWNKYNIKHLHIKECQKLTCRYWVEVNEDVCGTYNKNHRIKFNTTILHSNLLEVNVF